MKAVFALAAFVTHAAAQRLSILEPTPNSTIALGSNYTVELRQSPTLSSIQQVNVVIAITSCDDVCEDPSLWGPSIVIYNGPFDPQYNNAGPDKGPYQDFVFTLDAFWTKGETVLSVAHLYDLGNSRIPAFDYANVQVHVV